MPKVYSLEQPDREKVEQLNLELREHPEVKPRLTFPFPLNENRRNAMTMLESGKANLLEILRLFESNDFVEKKAAIFLMKTITEFSEIPEKDLSKVASKLKELEKIVMDQIVMGQNGDWATAEAAIKILGRVGESELPFLTKLSQQNENWFIREVAIEALCRIGEPALRVLAELSKKKDQSIRPALIFIQALERVGEKGLPLLTKLSHDKDPNVREIAVDAINSLKQKESNKDKPNQTKKKDFHSWLLASQKPLFAASHTPEVIYRIEKLQKIAEDLKEKYKEKFIGFVLLGSTNKGYAGPASDLDWGIIGQDRAMSDDFKEMAIKKGLLPCFEHYVGVDKNYQVSDNQSIMFYGLFFGDHDKLLELQRQYLENIDQPTWDKIRKEILGNETNISKAQKRFSLSDEEIAKMKVAISLLRVPPPYQETLEILRERAKSR